jgi:hypothetical protein
MKSSEVKEGETYLFVATDDATRKDLEGKTFYVAQKKTYRPGPKAHFARHYFVNSEGQKAHAEELQQLPPEDERCFECGIGEMKQVGSTQPNGTVNYECTHCFSNQSFP